MKKPEESGESRAGSGDEAHKDDYQYEHCFSYDWNTMKGYHCLMQLGDIFNTMARYSERPAKIVKDTGIRGVIRFVRKNIASPWLDRAWIKEQLAAPFRLRLTLE